MLSAQYCDAMLSTIQFNTNSYIAACNFYTIAFGVDVWNESNVKHFRLAECRLIFSVCDQWEKKIKFNLFAKNLCVKFIWNKS